MKATTRWQLAKCLERVLLLLVLAGVLILTPTGAEAKKRRSLLVKEAPPAEESAFQRGLVTEHLHYKNILFEHSRHWANTTHRHFHGTVLGYVTPWNAKGYQVALKFRSKFTHISPVWYQLKGLAAGPSLEGRGGVDGSWMKQLRADGAAVKVVPRVVMEGTHVKLMMESEDAQSRAIDILVSECLSQGFDGLVLEAWSSWVPAGVLDKPSLREKAINFVRKLAQALSSSSPALDLIFVIGPPGAGGGAHHVFTAMDLTFLAPYVAGFSLMTYDFSSPYSPGPNAPMRWIQACLVYLLPHVRPKHLEAFREQAHYKRELRSVVEEDNDEEEGGDGEREGEAEGDEIASKVLLGLNFYGNKFQQPQGGGPIVGHEFLELVDKHRPSIKWDEDSKEHRFTITSDTGTKADVFFPSLKSIAERLDEARAWGTGVSIWELGQGLDFFYDLL